MARSERFDADAQESERRRVEVCLRNNDLWFSLRLRIIATLRQLLFPAVLISSISCGHRN